MTHDETLRAVIERLIAEHADLLEQLAKWPEDYDYNRFQGDPNDPDFFEKVKAQVLRDARAQRAYDNDPALQDVLRRAAESPTSAGPRRRLARPPATGQDQAGPGQD